MTDVLAITRDVSPSIGRCELTHLERVPIDPVRAAGQHEALVDALERLGCRVERLPADTAYPDSVFIEDTAVVFDDLAVVTNPGAASRRGETAAVAEALRPHRPLCHVHEPATLDGGDVLHVGPDVYVGLSSRTNAAGVRRLSSLLEPHGLRVRGVEFTGCLHLKSAVTVVADETLLVQPRWVDPRRFGDRATISVDESEAFAANALRLGDTVVYPEAFPRTRARLVAHGIPVTTVPADELARAEGGVTCCVLFVKEPVAND